VVIGLYFWSSPCKFQKLTRERKGSLGNLCESDFYRFSKPGNMRRSRKPYWVTMITVVTTLNLALPPSHGYSAMAIEALGIALVGVSIGYAVQMICNRMRGA